MLDHPLVQLIITFGLSGVAVLTFCVLKEYFRWLFTHKEVERDSQRLDQAIEDFKSPKQEEL